MSEPTPFPQRTTVRDEACTWISRLDAGLTSEQQRELDEWLAADPAHAQALLDFAKRWDDASVLAELGELFPLERYTRAPARRRNWRFAAAAACAALAALLAWFAPRMFAHLNADDVALAAMISYETAIGERSTVALPDGTVVTLNTDSRLEVRYSAEERAVTLQRGEGYFKVAHEPDRPFRVHAGGRIFQALGTAFNVRMQTPRTIEVTVVEGRVQVSESQAVGSSASSASTSAAAVESNPAERTIMTAGEFARLGRGPDLVLEIEPARIDARLAWQQGMVVFEGDSLEDVLREMSRYTSVEFVIRDDALRNVKVGGYFRAGDIDGLLDALRENFDIDAQVAADDRIILSAR